MPSVQQNRLWYDTLLNEIEDALGDTEADAEALANAAVEGLEALVDAGEVTVAAVLGVLTDAGIPEWAALVIAPVVAAAL